jgi:hypothetical protein
MRRPSRIRRWLKWGGVTVCVLLLMMWVFSIWGQVFWIVRIGNADWSVWMRAQHFVFERSDTINGYGIFGSATGGVAWLREPVTVPVLPHVIYDVMGESALDQPSPVRTSWELYFPLWLLFLLVAIPTGFLFWRDYRRIPEGHCQACGYNLTGNTSGICPECGETIKPSFVPSISRS